MPPTQSDPISVSAPTPSSNFLRAASPHHQNNHSASTPSLSSANKSLVGPSSSSAPSSPTHPSSNPAPLSIDNDKRRDRVTVTVFDWDDTLLASSFLSGRGYRLDSEMIHADVEQQLRELEQSVIVCLQMALQYGDVHVITNAENGWVELSARRFIPKVVPLLSQVRIISARSTYEGMFPEAPIKWKYYAMHEKLSPLFGQNHLEKNIISFGDSHVEREAVRAVTRSCPLTLCKSVKFAERPSMEQLRRQIELVTNCFSYIHNHQGDLDLQLTVTVNGPEQAQSAPQVNHHQTAPLVSPPSCMFPQNAMNDDANDMMNEDKPIAC